MSAHLRSSRRASGCGHLRNFRSAAPIVLLATMELVTDAGTATRVDDDVILLSTEVSVDNRGVVRVRDAAETQCGIRVKKRRN